MNNVIVGMSGGVDSSVAAARLVEEGHNVTGLFMKNWEEDDDAEYCAAKPSVSMARCACRPGEDDPWRTPRPGKRSVEEARIVRRELTGA